ncbi:MAG: 50S ribosomal protein L15 [Candidatus Ancaeobacter aquaticus]|nr:50S ribosomal protein L15 [Candidatus Ancaeobacter aquaticus]
MELWNLKNTRGARKAKKKIGRGPGSGHGKTSTRGHKGQKSRSGASSRPGFEGGQMPLHRRLPKRGFRNPFKKYYTIINVADLNSFSDGDTVSVEVLKEKKMIKNVKHGVKVLGNGDVKKKVTVIADCFSAVAKKKIEECGGKCVDVHSKTEKASA